LMKYMNLLIWPLALVVLYGMDTTPGPSLCVFRFMGFRSCPGCGLGHAIHEALHLNWQQSIRDHILGIPTTMVLLFQVLKSFHTFTKTTRLYGSQTAHDASGPAAR
jgi:hypothetical protein